MDVPKEFRQDFDAFPQLLRALLDAELAAGNEVAEFGHGFPAPPVGAYIKLSRPVTTRPRESGDGLCFRDYNSSSYSGEFTDERGHFFILEPPAPPEPEPDMDAIRAAHSGGFSRTPPKPAVPPAPIPEPARPGEPESAFQRFLRSMVMDYEKWHDGDGYDLDALREATPNERMAIEATLLARGVNDWRDVEALAALDTPGARRALQAAAKHADPQIRLAVSRHAGVLIPDEQRVASLVKALETARFYGGLTQALDEVEDFHPPAVVEALFHGALKREGEAAVHFAAMLMFVHGAADVPFDMEQRPFFLRFHTENRAEREAVFRELCERVAVDASRYLA
jgi:hypothetical protein